MEHHTQPVHICRRCDRCTADLFRCGIVRSQRPPAELRKLCLPSLTIGDELCDAEVEQLYLASGGDQNIGWLEVPMNDQMRVSVLHSIHHLPEKPQAISD